MFYRSISFYEISKIYMHTAFSWVFSDHNLLGDIALLQSTSVRSLFSNISFSSKMLQGNNLFRACKKIIDRSIDPKIQKQSSGGAL